MLEDLELLEALVVVVEQQELLLEEQVHQDREMLVVVA
jgi:hypothetical protein